MDRTGGRVDVVVPGIAAGARSVTDLALDDAAAVGAVVRTVRPGVVFGAMTALAVRRAAKLRLVAGDFRERVRAIVTVAVEGPVDDKVTHGEREDAEPEQDQNQSPDVFGHGRAAAGSGEDAAGRSINGGRCAWRPARQGCSPRDAR